MTQDEAFEFVKRGWASGRLASGYIISAPPRTIGQALAEQILGLCFCSADGPEACGVCRECEQTRRHSHPDALWVEPQSKSRTISVDQVRDLQRLIFHTSLGGGWKACVLVGADRLGKEGANAFLKTLEEPPPRTVFLLLTDSPQFLLPTVVSRCQLLAVSGTAQVIPDDLRDKLHEILLHYDALRRHGSIPSASGLAQGELVVKLLKDVRKVAEAEEKATLQEEDVEAGDDALDARISSRYRELRAGVMGSILGWYRDILLLVCGADEGTVMNRGDLDALHKAAGVLSYRDAMLNVVTVEDMNKQLERNLPERIVFGSGFCRMN